MDFSVLDWYAMEVCRSKVGKVTVKRLEWGPRTIVQFHRLVGCGSCLILSSFLTQLEMKIVRQGWARLWVFLIGLSKTVRRC